MTYLRRGLPAWGFDPILRFGLPEAGAAHGPVPGWAGLAGRGAALRRRLGRWVPGWALAGVLLSVAGAVAAQGPVGAAGPGGARGSALPLWEVGAVGFGVAQQAWPGASETVNQGLALPYVLYRGPWLRVDRGSAGLRAFKRPGFELDIGVAGSFGSASSGSAARQGMPSLGTRVEFGPRATWRLGDAPWGGRWQAVVPLRGVFDLSDGLAHRGLALEPELQWRHDGLGGWRVNLSAGALAGNRRLTGVFYEVTAAQATDLRPAYEARSGLIAWRLGLSATHRLSRDWRVFGFGRLDTVVGASNEDSPLVSRTTGLTAGLGLLWTWRRSAQPGAD